jgi:DUF1365 family protein
MHALVVRPVESTFALTLFRWLIVIDNIPLFALQKKIRAFSTVRGKFKLTTNKNHSVCEEKSPSLTPCSLLQIFIVVLK